MTISELERSFEVLLLQGRKWLRELCNASTSTPSYSFTFCTLFASLCLETPSLHVSPVPLSDRETRTIMAEIPSAKAGSATTLDPPSQSVPNSTPDASVPHASLSVSPTSTVVDRNASHGNREKHDPSGTVGHRTEEEEARLREESMPEGARLYLLMLGLALAI